MNTKSQSEEILSWLKQGNSISPLEALERFGCWRLGGRIRELRQAGHLITTTMISKNQKRFAEYRLTEQKQ